MKTKDFYKDRAEIYAVAVSERYGVQRDRDGHTFVYDRFPSKEEYLSHFKADLDDPSEELEDFDNLPDEENAKLEAEAVALVAKAYDEVARERDEFLKDK